MGFFFESVGLNTDIKRHMEKEKHLREEIKRLEDIQDKTDLDYAVISAYINILIKLIESKAIVVNKLGRK